MEFHSGDDMHAEMSVQTGVGKITFYISRLHIEGKVRTISGLPLCLATIVAKTVPCSLSLEHSYVYLLLCKQPFCATSLRTPISYLVGFRRLPNSMKLFLRDRRNL